MIDRQIVLPRQHVPVGAHANDLDEAKVGPLSPPRWWRRDHHAVKLQISLSLSHLGGELSHFHLATETANKHTRTSERL